MLVQCLVLQMCSLGFALVHKWSQRQAQENLCLGDFSYDCFRNCFFYLNWYIPYRMVAPVTSFIYFFGLLDSGKDDLVFISISLFLSSITSFFFLLTDFNLNFLSLKPNMFLLDDFGCQLLVCRYRRIVYVLLLIKQLSDSLKMDMFLSASELTVAMLSSLVGLRDRHQSGYSSRTHLLSVWKEVGVRSTPCEDSAFQLANWLQPEWQASLFELVSRSHLAKVPGKK